MKGKRLAVLTSYGIVLSLLLSASSPGTGRILNSAEHEVYPFGKYDPPIQLHIARPVDQTWTYPGGDSIEDNIWYREYRSLLGIEIEHDWTALPGSTAAS